MPTILGATTRNVVTWPNRCPEFVMCEMGITLLVVAPKLCMTIYQEPWNFHGGNIFIQCKTTW